MIAVLLGLGAGLSWGVADFFGGLASRRAAALGVVALSQLTGLVLVLGAIAIVRPEPLTTGQLGFAMASGLLGVLGLMAFYRALAVGTMSLVAPVAGLGALVPLTLDLARGRSPGTIALACMLLALAGAAVAARAPGRASRRGLGMAVLAGMAFGGFFVLLARAAEGGILWAVAAERLVATPVAILAAATLGTGLVVRGRTLALTVAAGLLDVLANFSFAAASGRQLVSVAAVLGSLYPLATVALASLVLAERLSRAQAVGAAAALTGVAMIAAG